MNFWFIFSGKDEGYLQVKRLRELFQLHDDVCCTLYACSTLYFRDGQNCLKSQDFKHPPVTSFYKYLFSCAFKVLLTIYAHCSLTSIVAARINEFHLEDPGDSYRSLFRLHNRLQPGILITEWLEIWLIITILSSIEQGFLPTSRFTEISNGPVQDRHFKSL